MGGGGEGTGESGVCMAGLRVSSTFDDVSCVVDESRSSL